MLRQQLRRTAVAVALCLPFTLVACGGGGGGGGGGAPDLSVSDPTLSPGPGTPSVPASGWGSAQQLGTLRDTFYTDIYRTSVAVNDANRAIVAWIESGDCGGSVWVSRFDGAQWSAALNLGVTAAMVERVAMNASGDAAVVWQQNYGQSCVGGAEIWVRRLTAGAWQAAERVSDASGSDFSFYAIDPVVTLDDAGNVTVAWSQGRSGTPSEIQGTYVRRFNGTSWSAATKISTPDRYSWETQAGVDAAGNVTVVWRQDTNLYDPSQTAGGPIQPAIWAARYVAANGSWTAAERIGSPDFAMTYDSEDRPRLSVASTGHVGVIWEGSVNGEPESIYSAHFDPVAATWSSAVPLEQGASQSYWPEIATDVSGNMQGVWVQDESGITNLYTARFDATSGTWSAPLPLETLDTDVEPPSVGIDASGRALVVWSQVSGISDRLFARHVTATGPETTVPIGYGSDQSLAVNAGGFAVVAQPKINYSPTAFVTSAYATIYVP